MSLSDSVSYGLGRKSVWTLARAQKRAGWRRSSSVLRLVLLLEQMEPLVTPPGGGNTSDQYG